MGFPPKHNLCREAIDYILKNPTDFQTTQQRAWQTVGPLLLTKLYNSKKYLDLHIFPSHFFLPIHYSGLTYQGHDKIYAHQEWGSTKQNYDNMTNIELPSILLPPTEWISILISSYNTKYDYISECLESIQNQEGFFGIELVWINDGSDDMNSTLLELLLDLFQKKSRFCKVIYNKNEKNKGVGYSLNKGVELCSNEFIFKMDSDDIMFPNRIQTQLTFMKEKNCVMCGSNVKLIQEKNNSWIIVGETNHSLEITLDQYKNNKLHWIMNHPSICFKKEAILEVGNYNFSQTLPLEDLELELKLLKKYQIIYNIKECLVFYRIHENQLTYNGKTMKPELVEYRNKMIDNCYLKL
jgi:cellulose synthase/poly-beta-1,6-N-acetylglucosamine synthase-like glycosyltransferase